MNTSEHLTNFVSLTFAEEVVLVCGEGRFDSVKKQEGCQGSLTNLGSKSGEKYLLKNKTKDFTFKNLCFLEFYLL